MSCSDPRGAFYVMWQSVSYLAANSIVRIISWLISQPLWHLYQYFPPLHAHTHTPYHPPTHSIRAIISPVAGSNKTVTQGRCLETLPAKSRYLTQEAQRQRRRNQNITVKVEGVFIWTTSRGLTGKQQALPLIRRGAGMPAHISLWIAAQRWEGCIYPWAK